jgi:hypothetical protein
MGKGGTAGHVSQCLQRVCVQSLKPLLGATRSLLKDAIGRLSRRSGASSAGTAGRLIPPAKPP